MRNGSTVTLGDLVTSHWSGYSFKSDEYTESGVPILTKGDIKPRGVIEHGGKYIAEERLSNKRIKLTDKRDFLVTTRDLTTAANFLGLVARAPRGGAFAVNQGVTIFRVDECRVDPQYLVHWCEGSLFRGHIKGHYAGATQIHIRHADVMAAPVQLPPMQEQRRIASVLSAYDELIENNMRRMAILEEMARRIYEEWFVRFRFPGHENVPIVESALGLIPEGWKHVRLSEIADVNARGIKRGKEPDEIVYVDISSVSTASIDQRQRMQFSDAPGRARRIVRDGDVIWSCVRPNRKSYAAVIDPEPGLVVSTGFAVLSATAVPWSYLYRAVTTEDFVAYLVNHAKGAAYPAVGAEDFEGAMMLKPSREVLASFSDICQPMMRLAAMLDQKNANLRTTRDLLLPKLISGELDVSAMPEPEAAAA